MSKSGGHVSVCEHVSVCGHVSVCVWICVCVCVWTHVCVSVCGHVSVCLCPCVWTLGVCVGQSRVAPGPDWFRRVTVLPNVRNGEMGPSCVLAGRKVPRAGWVLTAVGEWVPSAPLSPQCRPFPFSKHWLTLHPWDSQRVSGQDLHGCCTQGLGNWGMGPDWFVRGGGTVGACVHESPHTLASGCSGGGGNGQWGMWTLAP